MTKLRFLRPAAVLAAMAVSGMGLTLAVAPPAPAKAFNYDDRGGRTALWVYIRKHPNEGIWEACRRVYGRDVYQVRGAGKRKARCFIDASEAGNPQGFNTRNEFD